MATIRVKNPNLGGEKWITIPTKILSEADHIVTNKGQGDLYLSNDGTYKDVIKSANDYTDKLIELITGSSPDILETLKELSNQTSDNKDFINVLNKSIATKLDKTANAVSASKLATPIKLWGNDFDGSLSVYGNLCAPNGNLGLGISANNVILGNNTNPSYIYGSSVMFKTGTDAVSAYISPDGKVGIGTANPLVGFHVNVNSYFDYPIKVSGTVDYSSPLLKLDATNTNNNGLLVLSKLGNSKAAIGIDDTQGMWFLNLSNSNIFRITSNSLTYGSNKIWHEGNFNPSDYLPLSGGTVTGVVQIIDSNVAPFIVNTNTVAAGIQLISSSGSGYFLYYGDKDYYVTNNNWTNKYKIWHEGNDGSDSGLDADMLDGLHSGNFAKSLMDVGANNTKSNVLGYTYGTEAHGGASAGGLISAGMGTHGMQLNGAYNGNKLSFRGFSPDGYTDWKTIAFTDYNGFYDLYGGTRILPSANNIVDLNNYKTVGTYHVMQYSDTLYVENMPERNSFILHVVACNGASLYYLKQIFQPYDSAKEYVRFYPASSGRWSEWWLSNDDLNTYNAPTATKATQDSEGNVITDTYALKSDLIIGLNATDGVYAVKADGSLCTIDEADTSCTGVALIAGEHKFMIAKSDATDGSNSTLYWTNNTSDLSLTNYSKVDGTNGSGNLPKPDGTFGGSTHLSDDFTTWKAGALSDFNGKANTAVIAEASSHAKDMCTVLNTFNASDSFKDWYVPACGQLALMYLNMTEINAALVKIGGTALAADYYWSSSEYSSSYAWYVYFGNGYVYNSRRKDDDYRVRFIRDIQVESSKSIKDTIVEIKDQLKQPASSALKLATPIKLWGNDFDGSTYIDGDIGSTKSDFTIHAYNTELINLNTTGSYVNIAYGAGAKSYNTYVYGKDIRFKTDTTTNVKMIIANDGNVGIGTTDPLFKLDVNGDTYSNNIVLGTLGCITSSLTDTFNDSTGRNRPWYGLSFDVEKSSAERTILASYYGMLFKYGGNKFSVFDGGNIGIGTYNPQYKLDVNGSIRFSDSLYTERPFSIFTKNDNGEYSSILSVNSTGDLTVGYGTSEVGEFTNIDGNFVRLRYGTAHTKGMILNPSGNVTIGSSDMASVYHKLFVDGSVRTGQMYCTGDVVFGANSDGIYIKNSTILMHDSSNAYTTGAVTFTKLGDALFLHDISVINKIESGDLVDWYGVSWSENDSDPTCTRIGNMALHRSLPILNAMKRYSITNRAFSIPEAIRELTDEGRLKYGIANNEMHPIELGDFRQNVMVKIPEFWYIDDYEPSTRTHNLKISQTAKAGWIHHKEAYIGSYEGYNALSIYMSTKNVIPTVSASRETLRSLARANGSEDEYKWNIYTYEEHRAICHLFLVEYATRNSQAPVNTELTADGFKQGGLGSGCTTGAVTINGVTTYSFIPTGTTDSLGNGSGEVAYTVTLTDADGNETGTVTRYANRYRGIENPFGHIWKHVDDIVNVYNAETTYKTVYKCNKPEYFATNKNAKYKPLCSFPGGSKMQGWSKEIKATINCDFFKYSVGGGSESTYWCDYNYDNDDISEHCLLIGGSSGYGGYAGLFYLVLHHGVGYSGAAVGSRLTYLPWAE